MTALIVPAGTVPPSDLDAEGVVLSAIFVRPEAFDRVEPTLKAEHFYANANRLIFEAMAELVGQGRPCDVEAVAGWLRDRNKLQRVGGTPYLAQVMNHTPAVAHLEAYAKTIIDKARLRRVIAEAQTIAAEGYGNPDNVEQFVQESEARIYTAAQDLVRAQSTKSAQEVMSMCVNEINARRQGLIARGIRTGFTGLDRKIGGLRSGRVYTAAGRPGMGKTSFLTQTIGKLSASDDVKRGSVMFSLEMPSEQIGERLISQESRVDTRNVEAGMLTPQQLADVTTAAQDISRWPLIIEDRPAITVPEMRSVLRRAVKALESNHGVRLGLVGIDYLQLVGTRDLPKGLNDNSALENIMKGLVSIAKEFDVPVILLSQLNRDCEKRPDKRPQLSDLRSSGSIEQDSHTVIFFHRDDVYRKPGEAKDRTAEFIIAKARSGRTGTVPMTFIDYCTRYENAELPEEHDEFADMFDSGFDDPPQTYGEQF